jgi:hypothetical protein
MWYRNSVSRSGRLPLGLSAYHPAGARLYLAFRTRPARVPNIVMEVITRTLKGRRGTRGTSAATETPP